MTNKRAKDAIGRILPHGRDGKLEIPVYHGTRYALALGARAVGIGRPYLWGLGAFGQPGVERVLDILRHELELVMAQCGARSLGEIQPAHVLRA